MKEQSFSLVQALLQSGGKKLRCLFTVKMVTKVLLTAAPHEVLPRCAGSLLGRRGHTERNDGDWREIQLEMTESDALSPTSCIFLGPSLHRPPGGRGAGGSARCARRKGMMLQGAQPGKAAVGTAASSCPPGGGE